MEKETLKQEKQERVALSLEEQLRLFEQSKDGNETARETLIFYHMPLVKFMMFRHFKGINYENYPDVFSAGTIGLVEGIDTFDPNYGTRPSTYLSTCIKNEIRNEVARLKANTGGVQIPKETYRVMTILKSIKHQSDQEGSMGIDEIVSYYLDNIEDLDLPKRSKEFLYEILQNNISIISFDHSIAENLNIEAIVGKKDPSYERVDNSGLLKLFKFLSDDEKRVILLNFGFGEEQYSEKDIAKQLEIPLSKVVYLKRRALAKLRGLVEVK